MRIIIENLLILISLFKIQAETDINTIYTTEAFHTVFHLTNNETYSSIDGFDVMASLAGHADLPRWMHYFQRNAHSNIGYFYGTPPPEMDGDLDLDVVIMNRYNFDTTRHQIKYRIINRDEIARYEVEMKLLKIDIGDFFQRNMTAMLEQIFADKLWKHPSIYLTLVARPNDIGARFPLDPAEKESVIVRIGSAIQNFTTDLLMLESEVRHVRHRVPCPRLYTSVEYIFREKHFSVDWCHFQLIYGNEINKNSKL